MLDRRSSNGLMVIRIEAIFVANSNLLYLFCIKMVNL